MAQIKIETDEDKDLSRIIFSGEVTGKNILDALERFYGSIVTSKVLWDFSNSDVSQLQTEELFTIIDTAKQYAHRRSGGKTALFVMGALAYGIARMHKALSDLDKYPIPLEIFTSEEEALAWLNS